MLDVNTLVDPAWAWQTYQPTRQNPWNRAKAAHLYRRAGFGATPAQLDEAVTQGPGATVKAWIQQAQALAVKPPADALTEGVAARRSLESLEAWWLHRMHGHQCQLLEKMTLFWHGHFATSGAKVTNARLMYDQNQLLRRHALGKLEPLVCGISRDPAMLTYLDSTDNRKTRPNENYARELLELFCLGLDQYTEKDIQEIARCFTGWQVRRERFRFNRYQHDDGVKSFFGKSGPFGGDEAVRIVLNQKVASEFIATKLVRFLVVDEPQPSGELIQPLARQLRESEFDIGSVVETILTSNFFYSDHCIGRKIRSPIELAIGTMRSLQASTDLFQLSQSLQQLGQRLFHPPNVKGWDGGRAWINSSTLIERMNLMDRLTDKNQTRFQDGGLHRWAVRHRKTDPSSQVAWLCELLVATPLPDDVIQSLERLAGAKPGDPDDRLATVLRAIAALPEFQLC